MADEHVDFHPVELSAHFLLSGPLDNLHESFTSLQESQKMLLTRLHLIEKRLTSVSGHLDCSLIDASGMHTRVKTLQKKLSECTGTIKKIEAKVGALERET